MALAGSLAPARAEANCCSTETLIAVIGFRNVLAHEYGHVNDEEVYETLQTGLSVYDTYSQHVARWMQTTDE